jgi:hypothetical protein
MPSGLDSEKVPTVAAGCMSCCRRYVRGHAPNGAARHHKGGRNCTSPKIISSRLTRRSPRLNEPLESLVNVPGLSLCCSCGMWTNKYQKCHRHSLGWRLRGVSDHTDCPHSIDHQSIVNFGALICRDDSNNTTAGTALKAARRRSSQTQAGEI